jgi:hypothetical protein
MSTPNKVRVQKHRAKLREEGCGRLEVWIGLGTIDDLREIAKRKKRPLWGVVQEALIAYVERGPGNSSPKANFC